MALPDGSNKQQYTVSSATTDFDFPYKYWDATDFVVTIVDLTSGTESVLDYSAGDYVVTATNADPSLGATIVTATSYDDHRITIERIIPIESESDFVRGDGLPPDALNSEFDKSAAQRQQLNDQIGRQVSHPSSDADGLSYEAPTVELRASKALGWDANGSVVALDLATSGTVSVDANAGLEINSNIISAKIDTDVMEFDSGDITVKDSGISTGKIVDDAITTAKIVDDAVTIDKIASLSGADTTIVTGTAGTAEYLGKWNSDGDIIEGPSIASLPTEGYAPTAYAGGESVTFPNGMIIKTGFYSTTTNGTKVITFDEAFPTGVVSAQISFKGTAADDAYFPVSALTTSAVTVILGDVNFSLGLYWTVIGY